MAVISTDVLVVGGGLIGLSTAMQLQQMRPRQTITLIEKDEQIALQQSGHNSGVLHAGIYYEPGSQKARFCVEGNRALSEFCDQYGVPVVRCGKVIVASTEAEVKRLLRLHARGIENGVPGLRIVTREELNEIEPHVVAKKALYAPNSAIVDYTKVAETYACVFSNAGGRIELDCAFLSADFANGQHRVASSRLEFNAKLVINCGGLHSDIIARKMGAEPKLRIIPFRGEFYELVESRRSLVRGLIYPVPDPSLPFLDVHFTPRVDGSVDAGPNAVLAGMREGYRWSDFSWSEFGATLSYPGFWMLAARNVRAGIAEINRSLRKKVFVRSLQRLVPDTQMEDLVPGKSGVRAQAVDERGHLIDDFQVEETLGAIHVLNAPSPAATSSLMIGKYIANKADVRINNA